MAGGVSNYKTLLDQIRRVPALLVTFNYDTLLEKAIGRKFAQTSDYLNKHELSVLKLHGSTDWRQIIASGVRYPSPQTSASDREIIDSAAALTFGKIIHKEETEGHQRQRIDFVPSCFVPALAIPIAEKREFVCPKDHLDFLCAALPNVTKIIIIGWRASEAHFLDLLKEYLKPGVQAIAVCGPGEESRNSLDRLRDAGINGDFAAIPQGFTEFVRSRKAEQFLSSV